MPPFLAVVKKELQSVIRDRTILIAVLIQLFIASFSSGLLLGVLSLYDPDTIMQSGSVEVKIGLVGPSGNPLEALMLESDLHVIPYATQAEAEAAFYQNKVNAVVLVPPNAGVSGSAGSTSEIKLYLPSSDAASSLIRMVIQGPLKKYENYLRAQNGIEVRYTDLAGKPSTSFEFVYSVLLPMLMFFPAFVAGSMSIDSLTEEVENNTMQTLLSAPLTVNNMIGAKIVATVIISTLQCIAWLTLMQLNGIAIQNTPWILLLAVIVAGITSTSAMLAAVFLKDRERSQFIYSLMLLAATGIGTLLDISPIKTLSRLGIGDYYTTGWNVAMFAVFLAALYLLLLKTSRRMIV
jgi:ABC-2 type transport system permease protein